MNNNEHYGGERKMQDHGQLYKAVREPIDLVPEVYPTDFFRCLFDCHNDCLLYFVWPGFRIASRWAVTLIIGIGGQYRS